uniref:Uncharacterized protein n=1 Tax=Solanum lycopersicum TaxID=4081 RepID=A0A3Q7EV43_SOLLC
MQENLCRSHTLPLNKLCKKLRCEFEVLKLVIVIKNIYILIHAKVENNFTCTIKKGKPVILAKQTKALIRT